MATFTFRYVVMDPMIISMQLHMVDSDLYTCCGVMTDHRISTVFVEAARSRYTGVSTIYACFFSLLNER